MTIRILDTVVQEYVEVGNSEHIVEDFTNHEASIDRFKHVVRAGGHVRQFSAVAPTRATPSPPLPQRNRRHELPLAELE